jgi:hypothetical protein
VDAAQYGWRPATRSSARSNASVFGADALPHGQDPLRPIMATASMVATRRDADAGRAAATSELPRDRRDPAASHGRGKMQR